MRIAITGSSGLIGTRLVTDLAATGHEVTRVVRSSSPVGSGKITWDPVAGHIDAEGLEGQDAVIHLAGETLAGIWTAGKKARILSSRVRGTKLLSEALAGLARPPAVLLCASAVGYYGPHPGGEVDEGSASGEGFLAEVVREWEAAARPAAEAGIRVVHLRLGVVLSATGGMLGLVLPFFRAGLGARLGSGRQSMSWVAHSEITPVVEFLLARPELAGAVNVVAPEPVSNAEFTKTLADVLRRPAPFVLPAWLLRLVGGEMARGTMLSDQVVRPVRLLKAGYTFRYPELESALRHELGRW